MFTTVVLAVSLAARPQDAQTKTPTFEVASITRTPPAGNGLVMIRLPELRGSRVAAEGVTLLMLIRNAYAPRYQMQGQIVGGPAWLESDRFNVTAKAEGMPTSDELRLMVQQLLADRFKLSVHREMRELPVFSLVLAKNDGRLGRELRRADVDCDALRKAQTAGDQPAFPLLKPGDSPPACFVTMAMAPTSIRMQSGGSTMEEIASRLSQFAGRPIIDRTGLSGYYSVNLEFAREPGVGPAPLLGPAPSDAFAGNSPATPSDIPTLAAAVQDQLGLKLESQRERAEVLVIDRAEPPTAD